MIVPLYPLVFPLLFLVIVVRIDRLQQQGAQGHYNSRNRRETTQPFHPAEFHSFMYIHLLHKPAY